MTALALRKMKRGRRVFSNYPIVSPDRKYSSLEWKPKYIYECIHDADIIIDEAYRDYSSRNFKDFGVDCHTFFATNRHNDLNVYLIAQNPARVDVIIREMCNEFLAVKKHAIPFIDRPLWFTMIGYDTEENMAQKNPDAVSSKESFIFNKYVAGSYDTHQFRNPDDKPLMGVPWIEILKLGKAPQPAGLRDVLAKFPWLFLEKIKKMV
jgi:hypothetical protein